MPGLTRRAGKRAALHIETRASVAAAVADGTVVRVGLEGATRDLARHDGAATCLAISSAGVTASGGHDGCVRVGDAVVLESGDWIERLTWRPDGARLAVARGRHVVLLEEGTWNAATSPALDSTVTCLGWHPRGVTIAAGHYGGVVLFRGRDARPDARLAWKGSVLELAVSPDGRRLAHGNQDATVHFWEISKRQELHMWGYETKVRQLSWRADGRFLATGGGTAITVWDFAGRGPEGSRPIELEQHDGLVSWIGFRGATDTLASAGEDGLLCLWEPGRTNRVTAAVALEAPVTCAAWSPDGSRLAAATADGTIVICEPGAAA
jgi:WD40 repeat protein